MKKISMGIKQLSYCFFMVIGSLLYLQAAAQPQNIACLGNGKMAVYENNAAIFQVFGPPYSAPSVLEMLPDTGISTVSIREKGTAIWKHHLYRNGKNIAEIIDFVTDSLPCFVRKIRCSEPVYFHMTRPAAVQSFINTKTYTPNTVTQSLLLRTAAGTFVYGHYPMGEESYHQLLIKGNALLNDSSLNCAPGETIFMICGGPSYPECIANSTRVLQQEPLSLLEKTRNYWLGFTGRRMNFDSIVAPNVPLRKKLLQEIDDVAILIKTQQSAEGAVLAGYNYHLGYIRDQYGVSRCMLKLGYYQEARAILDFYFNIWLRKGVLHNAQGIGMDAFHIHENDEVEITGYLIVQAFDYYTKTRDSSFLNKIMPMLEWAWNCQSKNLVKDMLPFNGDETYIAGGILPRTTLLDGSAEATLLFIESGRLLLHWIEQHHLWPDTTILYNQKILQRVTAHYAQHFIDNGKLLTNNPKRMEGVVYPPFRHGVCEAIGAPGCAVFGWTQRTNNNRYLCPHCFATQSLPPASPQKFYIPSVSLMPFYIGAKNLSIQQKTHLVKQVSNVYQNTGKFPSSPTSADRIVGYDYGLFLYSLTHTNDPLQMQVYLQMMHASDATGAWVEYYEKGQPMGTRCRPWESGINLEAAINFAEHYQHH